MPSFKNGDVEIAYLDEGDGEPIVLVHGFASTKEVNWVQPGWVSALNRAGRRAIALDNRGHGASSKLYDPAAYHSATMADDVRALLDHLNIERADIMGYSMGARITAFLAVEAPRASALRNTRRIRYPPCRRRRPAGKHRRGPRGGFSGRHQGSNGRMFRAFADQTKSDLTCARCLYPRIPANFDTRASRCNSRASSRCHRHERPGGGIGAGPCCAYSGRAGSRYPEPRPYARRRRQDLQSRRYSTSLTNAHEPCGSRLAAPSLCLRICVKRLR